MTETQYDYLSGTNQRTARHEFELREKCSWRVNKKAGKSTPLTKE